MDTQNMSMATEMQATPLEGSFVEADKYGNMMTSLTADDLTTAGFTLGDIITVTVNGNNYDCPIVTTYSDVNVGEYLFRVKDNATYFSINYGNCQKKTGAEAAMPLSLTMKEKGGYLVEYQIRHLEKSELRSDYASDVIFANFRDVETKNIKPHTLYRSCNPALGDARAPYADTLAMEAGVKTIINLADSKESLEKTIDPTSWYNGMYQAGRVILLDLDVDYSGADFGKSLAQGFKFMAAGEAPVLIHCNEGKDRAGFTSVILEALMGAPLSEITDDYMMSYVNYYDVTKGTAQYTSIAKTPYTMLMTIAQGMDVTDENLSTIAYNYMIRNGVSDSEIAAIKAKLQ